MSEMNKWCEEKIGRQVFEYQALNEHKCLENFKKCRIAYELTNATQPIILKYGLKPADVYFTKYLNAELRKQNPSWDKLLPEDLHTEFENDMHDNPDKVFVIKIPRWNEEGCKYFINAMDEYLMEEFGRLIFAYQITPRHTKRNK